MQALFARRRAFLVLFGALVAQLLLLSFQITRNQNVRLIQVWAVAVFDPAERALNKIVRAGAQAWTSLSRLRRAQQENQELRVQLVTARSQVLQLSEQAAEAQRLRALLEFKNRLPLQVVAAEVIATSPGENSNAVFIDKGQDAGLTADLAVVTPEGVVGKTIAVFSRTAQVLLITDSMSGVGCVLERRRLQGVAKGIGQGLCQLNYVMNEENVAVGESVLTSGLDQIYPKGLPVGIVVETGEGNIYRKVIVKPLAHLTRLEEVLVILKPNGAEQEAMNLRAQP